MNEKSSSMTGRMDQADKQKLIAQILIGSAWIDHRLEPEEKKYLQTFLERSKLDGDPELAEMLTEPIPAQTTENRLVQYLRSASREERMQLLAHIGKVLIADDTVSDIEHDLLDDYHNLMARIPAMPEFAELDFIPSEVGKAARQIGSFVVDVINRIAK